MDLSRLSADDKLLLSRIDDMIYRCEKNYSASYSSFLDERECVIAEEYAASASDGCMVMLYGGYEGAGRKILCIHSEYDEISGADFPIKTVKFTFRREDRLSHRDFLGSLMAMQIKRTLVGDIVCSEGEAYAFLSPVAADMACSLSKIGRVGVKTSLVDGSDVVRQDSFSEISGSAASLRLDCVLSIALRLSREKTASLIRGGNVTVNHFPTENLSLMMKDGDLMSVRGHGRYILCTSGELTGRGRIHVTLKKYL